MSTADGERNAVRGYQRQYDLLAERVYNAVVDDTFVSLRLTDPLAGKVDDLVLVTSGGPIGHQIKTTKPAGTLTFNDLLKARKTRSGKSAPSWLSSLAEGWAALGGPADDAKVTFVTNSRASVRDRIPTHDDAIGRHDFATFQCDVLIPLSDGSLTLAAVPALWAHAIQRIGTEVGLVDEGLGSFLRSLEIVCGAHDPLATSDLHRRADITNLSSELFRMVSDSDGVVDLDLASVLDAMGWTERVRLFSRQEFPVDLDTYEPLDAAIAELGNQLDRTTRGYLAVVGPPGSGKSTLLTQSMTSSSDRIVRYYAYVPGPGTSRTRMEGIGFLHDVVLLLDGPSGNRGHLIELGKEELRIALVDHLQAANQRFLQGGQRTLIVVDGLDHVERDAPGAESLLSELPRPDAIPEGVVFIVGTRTLTPLPPEARQHIADEGRQLNLDDFRLERDAVLSICQRVWVSDLGPEVHQRIVELAAGHPLSLSYLLNRLAGVGDEDEAVSLLADHPPYEGDIAEQYRAIWESLESEPLVQELLAIVTRLRVSFTLDDLLLWFDTPTVRSFRDKVTYLFRQVGPFRTVFHDSFRQYVVTQSNPSDRPKTDPGWDANYQARIADLCKYATRPALQWEELYHRQRAGQEFLPLASQAAFRAQCIGLRSSSLVREDLAIVLRAASEQRDLLALIDAALAKTEAEARWRELESVDVPGAFLDAKLPEDAVAYSGIDYERRIPLAQAYNLAKRLGLENNADGRHVFNLIEVTLFDDSDFTRYAGHDNDVYLAWAEAAPLYRPLEQVIGIAKRLFSTASPSEWDHEHREAQHRFHEVVGRIIDTLADLGRIEELTAVDDALRELLSDHEDDQSMLVDCRLRILERRSDADPDETSAVVPVQEGLELAMAMSSMRRDTLIRWAELAVRFDYLDQAEALLGWTSLDLEISTGDLGYSRDGALLERFRYWRLRHQLLRRREPGRSSELLESRQLNSTTPAGNSIDPKAASHKNWRAIDLAKEFDKAIRILAAAAAAEDEGDPYDGERLTREVVPMLDIAKFSEGRQATVDGLGTHRPEFLELIVSVVLTNESAAAADLSERIGTRIPEEPIAWPVTLRLSLGEQFSEAGARPEWYRSAILEGEAELTESEMDVNGRLDQTALLVRRYAAIGDIDAARRLARTLPQIAFGVGYRKDYQFDVWAAWLRRAVDDGLPDSTREVIAFGHLLTAVAPMTEGVPRHTAAKLPSMLAATHPGVSVLLFEQLVRKGTTWHLEALAQLITDLVPHLGQAPAVVEAAARLVTNLLVRCATGSYPEALRAVASSYREILDDASCAAAIDEMRQRVERDALATDRAGWLSGLGAPTPSDEDDDRESNYGGIDLVDGTHLTEREADAFIVDVASMINLKERTESDSFHWDEALGRVMPSATEVAKLDELFAIERSYRGSSIQVALGRHWLQLGNSNLALSHATAALESADENGWGSGWGSARLDAHNLAVEAGGEKERDRAWIDVAYCASSSPWRAEIMLHELTSIMALLDQAPSAVDLWALARSHLDGMATNLELDDEDPIEHQPVRWWLPGQSDTVERLNEQSSAHQALAVLIVDHASHFHWNVRDPAISIAARGISSGFTHVADAIDTVLESDPPDDVAEALGRAVSVSRSTALPRSQSLLAIHPNQFVRDLSKAPRHSPASLPARYRLALPPGGSRVLGTTEVTVGPYRDIVELCALAAGLDPRIVIEHALTAMRERRDEYPTERETRAALDASGMRFQRPLISIVLARSVVGRLVRDFADAGYLDSLAPADAEILRSFDPALVGQEPVSRPTFAPPPPPTGHDTTGERWIDGTAARLAEYVEALESTGDFVVAAFSTATVLNWAHAREEFSTFCVLGTADEGDLPDRPTQEFCSLKSDLVSEISADEPETGEPLSIENWAPFHQVEAHWIALSPSLARYLGWAPVESDPGTWETSGGQATIKVIEWVDGWPGRGDRAFDDADGAGTLVVATLAGMRDLSRLGQFTRVSRIHRRATVDEGGGSIEVDDEASRIDLVNLSTLLER